MAKKTHRSLEEILNSLKDAEKEFDEKLDKYGLKDVKPKKSEEEGIPEQEDNNETDQEKTQANPQDETSTEPQEVPSDTEQQ